MYLFFNRFLQSWQAFCIPWQESPGKHSPLVWSRINSTWFEFNAARLDLLNSRIRSLRIIIIIAFSIHSIRCKKIFVFWQVFCSPSAKVPISGNLVCSLMSLINCHSLLIFFRRNSIKWKPSYPLIFIYSGNLVYTVTAHLRATLC